MGQVSLTGTPPSEEKVGVLYQEEVYGFPLFNSNTVRQDDWRLNRGPSRQLLNAKNVA